MVVSVEGGDDGQREKSLPKKQKKKSRFYAVRRGRQVGIYTDHVKYQEQVLGFKGCEARTFVSRKQAEAWLREEQHESKSEDESKNSENKKLGGHQGDRTGQRGGGNLVRSTRGQIASADGKSVASRPCLTSTAVRRGGLVEIIGLKLPRQEPTNWEVTSAEWYREVINGNESHGVGALFCRSIDSDGERRCSLDYWQRLESAMIGLALDALPSREEEERIELAKARIVAEMERWNPTARSRGGFSRQLANATWNFTLKAFGSTASGLHGRGSDVDMQMDGTFYEGGVKEKTRHVLEMRREDAKRLVHVFGGRLSILPGRYSVQKIPNARMPILKVRDLQLDVSCDIAFPNDGAIDWPKSELLLVLNHLDSRLRPLLALVKLWAGAAQLRDASIGRFNTYTLTSLVIYYLQTIEVPVLPPLSEIIPPGLMEAARRYDDLSEHVAGMAARAKNWRHQQHQRRKVNTDGVMELFLGFLGWMGDTFDEILGFGAKEQRRPLKIVTYWATCVDCEGTDRHGNAKLLHVADPFDLGDNSARALTLTCLSHASRCARNARLACGELEVDAWVNFVFRDGPKEGPKKKVRSKRNVKKGGGRGGRGDWRGGRV